MALVTATSEVGIVNLALSRMGSTQVISAFDGLSNEAIQGALWYPQTRDAILADFPYPWAEAYFVLPEVAGPETTQTRANAQWLRSYRYPSDCLKLRRIVRTPYALLAGGIPQTTGGNGINYWYNEPWRRAVGDAYPVSYGLGNDSIGRLIMSDWYGCNGLTAIYTQAVTDPTQFDADFTDTLVWRLAVELSMSLGFSATIRQQCEKMYEGTIRKARATAYNAIASDIPYIRTQAETIRARWGG